MRTVVVGTAGHIDHGKTTLLRALTGIDADRLPEERRRGMTIDVGFAHLDLPDGSSIDFVDVPGHDRLVANMLVGAGEVDAGLLVVAADEGPKAQTLEHLELLDALAVADGIAVVTKADRLAADDPERGMRLAAVRSLLAGTTLAGAPVLLASATTGEGLDAVRDALVTLRDRVLERLAGDDARPARLAIDRVFSVAGRGTVATGTLRGGPLAPGSVVRILPGADEARAREVQVHGRSVDVAEGGRTAVNLVGFEVEELRRGMVLSLDPAIESTERLLVRLHPRDATAPSGDLRLHLGTAQVGARVGRGTRTTLGLPGGVLVAELRLDEPVAAAAGDRFVLRRPSPGRLEAGGIVLDPRPPVGASRRRTTPDRLEALATARSGLATATALLDLHGALPVARCRAIAGEAGAGAPAVGGLVLARDVLDDLAREAVARVQAHHEADPGSGGMQLGALRTSLAHEVRRRVAASPPDASMAATAIVDGLAAAGRLARDGDTVRDPGRATAVPSDLAAAMDRLEAALAVPAPPPFADAVAATACPPEGVRRLERTGRIVRLDPELAYATITYRALALRALDLARSGPLSPAGFRDATGTSRRYVLAILEDLDRRGVLVRGPVGHVPGPRADVPAALP